MRCLLLLLVAGAAACGDAAGVARPFENGSSPAFDAVWQVNSHNAYWVNRGVSGDALAGGVSERLLDQLLVDHVRSLEIDVHRDDAEAGGFLVYHTVPGNSVCATLPECLGILRAFHRAVPQHEVVLIVVELKELFRSNFDEKHRIEDLDAVFERELGPLLYRPRDVLARCEGAPGLERLGACVAAVGWESIAALRGRFMVAVLGNWDILRGQATVDWVRYAASGVKDRVAFPMVSAWRMDYAALEPDLRDLITPAEHQRALDESAMVQIEAIDDPAAPAFLARRGVVRVDQADAAAAVAAGMQLFQSDQPWEQYDDRGVAEPFRSFAAAVPRAETTEPGRRFALRAAGPDEKVFAQAAVEGPARWETTVSFGADATRIGCLRAAAAGPLETSASICAQKRSGNPDAPASAAGTPDAERVTALLRICRDGVCSESTLAETAGAGEMLALTVEPRSAGSCIRGFSARVVDRSFEPAWTPVGSEACFDLKLGLQGPARPAGGSSASYFFGTTRSGMAVDAPALSVMVEPPVGEPRMDATRLEDLSP